MKPSNAKRKRAHRGNEKRWNRNADPFEYVKNRKHWGEFLKKKYAVGA